MAFILNKRLEISLASLNVRSFDPPTRNQAVQELSKEKEGGTVIAPDKFPRIKKQLMPRPSLERAATVDIIVLINSSEK